MTCITLSVAPIYFSRFTSHHTLHASSCPMELSLLDKHSMTLYSSEALWYILLPLPWLLSSIFFFFLLKSSFSFLNIQMKYAFLTQSGKLLMISLGSHDTLFLKLFKWCCSESLYSQRPSPVPFDFFEDWDNALLIKLYLIFFAVPGIWHVIKRDLMNKGKGEWIEQHTTSLKRRKLRSIEFKGYGS